MSDGAYGFLMGVLVMVAVLSLFGPAILSIPRVNMCVTYADNSGSACSIIDDECWCEDENGHLAPAGAEGLSPE